MTLNKSKIFNGFFRNNLGCQDDLARITEPLKRNFGIDDFWHLTVHENGSLANISTHYDQWGYGWENECFKNLDFLIAPSRLKEGSFLLEFDENFVKVQDTFMDKYPQYHPFIMIRKEKKKAHILGFASRKKISSLPSFYVNNLSILNSFLDYYFTSKLSATSSSEESMIDIAALRGRDLFYKKTYGHESLAKPELCCNFFKQIGVNPSLLLAAKNLSKREKEVLIGCLAGKTAAQSGNELDLSARTVQFYLDNAKNKLGIISREELLQSLQILKMAALLDL